MLQGGKREVPNETVCSHGLLPQGLDPPGTQVPGVSSLLMVSDCCLETVTAAVGQMRKLGFYRFPQTPFMQPVWPAQQKSSPRALQASWIICINSAFF